MHTYIHTYINLSIRLKYILHTYIRRPTVHHRYVPARRISIPIFIVGGILRSISYDRWQRLGTIVQVLIFLYLGMYVYIKSRLVVYLHVCMYVCMYVCMKTHSCDLTYTYILYDCVSFTVYT